MIIQFYLRYQSLFGQTLYLQYEGNAVEMRFLNEQYWTVDIVLEISGVFEYGYVLKDVDGNFIRDAESPRKLDLSKITAKSLLLRDTWNSGANFENTFYTSAFQNTLFPPAAPALSKTKAWRGNTHVFRVKAPLLKKNEQLCILGSSIELGIWQKATPILMYLEAGWWVAKLSFLPESIKNGFPINYKYGIFNTQSKMFQYYEAGENRTIEELPQKGKVYVYSDGFAQLHNNTFKAAGVAIPVFSLRSGNSYGVGEFSDIMLLADWAKKTGIKLIQLLPINDTNANCSDFDSYPYRAISSYALHPIYINLDKIAGRENKFLIKKWRKAKRAFNASPTVSYLPVLKHKLKALQTLFDLKSQEIFESEDYKTFFDANKHWLEPYAVFCKFRDKYKTSDFTSWPQHATYDEKAIQKVVNTGSRYYKKIALQYFIQYYLHLQLQEAVNYARKKTVVIKGDIPIGISRESVDAWQKPELFHLDQQSGAPPDMFAKKGQNWGFPTYNWDKMREDGYSWWKLRFQQMSRYFEAFRIDHILGFFRIWSIPIDAVEGIMGRFVPAIPLTINELQEAGIEFDYQRYCTPYITEEILEQTFQENVQAVKDHFLEPIQAGYFKLLPQFNTQQKIATYFNNKGWNVHKEWSANKEWNDSLHLLQPGLFDLVSNVLLFNSVSAKGKAFHCSINLPATLSYKALDFSDQAALYKVYLDYFYHRQEKLWRSTALQSLPVLKEATDMLVCGEDLGMVPSSVPEVMQSLGILSLEVQRMPKQRDTTFSHLENAPYLSVVTPGTHDMSTIRAWWEENSTLTAEFYRDILGKEDTPPIYCEPWINKAIVLQHLDSSAMWAVFQLQDLLGMDGTIRRKNPHEERINIPADPGHFWGYRMHLTLEQLIREQTFNAALFTYIKQSGR